MNVSGRFVELIVALLDLYVVLIIIRALMSWFVRDFRNRIYLWLVRITEPVLGPIRRIMPNMGVDLSPVVAIIMIQIVITLLRRIS